MRRLVTAAAVAIAALLTVAAPAAAHPLGNFTSNTFTRIQLQPEHVVLDYVLDLAEVPALQTMQRIDDDGDGEVGAAEEQGYTEQQCRELADGVVLTLDEARVDLTVDAAAVAFLPGQAGLQTLRLTCQLRSSALTFTDSSVLRFRDDNLPERVGWREVIAVGDGRAIRSSDVPEQSVSDELRAYPEEQLSSPLDVTAATVEVGSLGESTTGPAQPAANGPAGWIERITTRFTDAVASRDLTLAFGLVAGVLAMLLGALHALAPGHGKTVMAAYLVGRQGTAREALALGATVAITHTTGVLLLGIIVSASQTLAPERLYPLLGAISGLLFAVVGLTLLRQALANRRSGATHSHDHTNDGEHGHHHHGPRPGVGWRALLLPGLAGGLVPTPSALVVLLGGIAIGRAWFGVLLVLAYGIGMAATLVAAGYLLLRARAGLERRSTGRFERVQLLTANLPVVTSVLIMVGGVLIAARSVVAV